jgi:hypothetical protein
VRMYLSYLICCVNPHRSALPCTPVYPLAMPQTSEAPSEPIEGTRKRKPSRRVTENGDTLVKKKPKTFYRMPTTTQSSANSTANSPDTSDADPPASSPPCAQPHAPEDDTMSERSEPDTIEVLSDDSIEVVEDDDAELSG